MCYYSPMVALFRRNAPRLGLLVLLAVGLGCLFFLFELFVGLASPGAGGLPADNSSSATPFPLSAGANFIAMLAAATCLALGAGAILLLWKSRKTGPKRPLWIMACGGAVAAATLGLGLYLAVSAALRGGLPYGNVPTAGHQVNPAGIETVGLTVLATLVLLVMLVGVTKPRLVALPLLLLVANLALGLVGASVIGNLDLFGSPSTMEPAAAYTDTMTSLGFSEEDPAAPDDALDADDREEQEDDRPTRGIEGQLPRPEGEGLPEARATSGEGKLLPDIAGAIGDLLNSVDPGLRARAASDLARLAGKFPKPPASAISALAGAMESDSAAPVRAAAAQALGSLGDPAALSELAEAAAGDDDPAVRAAAVEALAELDDPAALAHLAEAIAGDADPAVRAAAAGALADLDDPAALSEIAEAMASDSSASVRAAAAGALGSAGDPAALSTLAEATAADNDPMVRAAAVGALADLDDSAALPPLAEAASGDSDPAVRAAAVEALAALDDPEALATLSEALDSDEAAPVRAAAAEALGSLGDPESVSQLAKAVTGDNDPRVRAACARALAKLDDPAAIPQLAEALDSDDSAPVRAAAAKALGSLEDPVALPQLTEALDSDESAPVRAAAADALGSLGDPAALPQLAETLDSDDSASVRAAACRGLGSIGDPQALSPLAKALESDDSAPVRAAAAEALGSLEDPVALPQLTEALDSDDSAPVRAAAADALGSLGDPAALPQLAETLDSDDSASVRAAACRGLGSIGDPQALSPLAKALESDASAPVRAAAAEALGSLEDPAALPQLAEALDSDDSAPVRAAAAEALGSLEDPAALPQLTEALDTDSSASVRASACRGLGSIGDPRALPQLAGALAGDDNSMVRAAAAEALGQLDDPKALSQLARAAESDDSAPVRAAAAQALGSLEDPAALSPLAEAAAADNDPAVRAAAVQALAELDDPDAITPLAQAVGDASPQVREAAKEALAGLGATVTPLETGGTLVSSGDVASGVSPSTSTRQAGESQPTPVLQVSGAGSVGYLRTGVGDVYRNGGWTQTPPVELRYGRDSQVRELVERNLPDQSGAGLSASQPPESALLAWPAPATSETSELAEITVRPVPPAAHIPAGVLPLSLYAEYIFATGAYRPFSATFRSDAPLTEFTWTARVPAFTTSQLNQAAVSGDPTYTQLPDDLPQRVRDLALQVTQGQSSPYLKAKALETFLRTRYSYAFADPGDSQPERGQDPADWFLFGSRKGTCGQFSTAFVVLARSVGIPARVVSGWAVTQTDQPQTVHSNQAHQWAEVAFNDLGWMTFEPTASGGAPSRTGEAGDVVSVAETPVIDPALEPVLEDIATENPQLATAISEQLDALTRDGSPVVDQLAEQLSAERPAAGDSAPDAGEAASEVLEALGAEVTPLENGGSVINWGGESSWLPGTTALQAGELPAAPVFQVTGGAGAGLLRTSTGDAYADGRWAQLDPADIPYESGADLPSLVASRFTGSDPTPFDSSQRADSSLLAWPGPRRGKSTGPERITVSAHPLVGSIPAGGVPISLGVAQIFGNGAYRPFSVTFANRQAIEEYAWVARDVKFSEAQLTAARASEDRSHTQLPGGLPDRIEKLAQRITGEQSGPYRKARAIENYLKAEYTYAFATPQSATLPAGRDPVDWFLFDSREGTAGQFSSAFVVLARSVGVPSRVVSGWATGKTGDTRTVFSNQAHQWAEVALKDVGWTTFDPTPMGGAPSRADGGATAVDLPEKPSAAAQATVTEITDFPARTQLGRPFTIGGSVTSLSGSPVDGMEVEVFINKQKEQGGILVGTGASTEGRFSLEIGLPSKFPRGSYQLIAHALGNSGYMESWSDPEIDVYSGAKFEFSGPDKIPVDLPVGLTGKLLEEAGDPIPNQEILLRIDEGPPSLISTNARGEFSFEVSFEDPGNHAIRVELAESGFLLGSVVELDVTATMPSLLEIDEPSGLPPGDEFPVSGTLRDHRGNPLTGQEVAVTVDDGDTHQVVTDSQGNFRLDDRVSATEDSKIEATFDGDGFIEPASYPPSSEATGEATSEATGSDAGATTGAEEEPDVSGSAGGVPEIVVEDPAAVARDGHIPLRGTVYDGGQPVPDTAVTVNGEELARTDAGGAFDIQFPVPPGAELGRMPLELAAPELNAATTVNAEVKSATSLDITPVEPVKAGEPLRAEARLLDENGVGIPNAALHFGDGETATTGPDGVAELVLPAPEQEDLSAVPLDVVFEGDESHLPVSHSEDVPVSSDEGGFNWLLWVGLPLALVLASVVAYLVLRRPPWFVALLRRASGFLALLLAGLPKRRKPEPVAGEEAELLPALLELSFPESPGAGETVSLSGEQVSVRCVLTGESGEPVRGATVELEWSDSGETTQLTTDRRGRCDATRSVDTGGVHQVTARFAGDERYLPVTASAEFELQGPAPTGMVATRLEVALFKPAEDLPDIWGTGEQVRVEIALLDSSGQGVAGRTVTAAMGEPAQPVQLLTDAGGRCRTDWTGTVPGTYRVSVDFAGAERNLPVSGQREFEVVDFREDVVRRYNSFLPWIREREPSISEQATPREMELKVVTSGMSVDQRALEVVISRFEEADYSLHEIDRPRFEAMYRARRNIMGD